MWNLRADYKDGTYIDKDIYDEDASDRRQYELEEWLIMHHEGCTFYSAVWINEGDELYEN